MALYVLQVVVYSIITSPCALYILDIKNYYSLDIIKILCIIQISRTHNLLARIIKMSLVYTKFSHQFFKKNCMILKWKFSSHCFHYRASVIECLMIELNSSSSINFVRSIVIHGFCCGLAHREGTFLAIFNSLLEIMIYNDENALLGTFPL
jgi:hypothetical protein